MAKDDMNLLMFKVLAYLYECIKNGEVPKSENFKVQNCFFAKDIKQEYLDFICITLEKEGYTQGFTSVKAWGGAEILLSHNAKITPAGFEFLKENSAMKKAYNYMKEIKGWIPIF